MLLVLLMIYLEASVDVEAGRSYYRGVTQLANSTVAINEQLIQTLESNKYAKYLVRQVLSNEAPAQTYQSVSSQTLNTNITVNDTIKDKADGLYDIVLGIMENGIASGPTALPGPNIILVLSSIHLDPNTCRKRTYTYYCW